jgi:hypothetical protein
MREVLVSCREKLKFFIADFHALGRHKKVAIKRLQNMFWTKIFFPFVTRR